LGQPVINVDTQKKELIGVFEQWPKVGAYG
jgi:hypothetical protein